MTALLYTLEKYNGPKSRHTCPSCQQKHQFARYVDPEGNYLADHVGRCNREGKCGHHIKPKDYFSENPTVKPREFSRVVQPKKPVQYIPANTLTSTLRSYESNSFVNYLHSLFDADTVKRITEMYGLGTTRDGSCIFWQVDQSGYVRTGKVIKYMSDGHRDKQHPPYFIHTKLGIDSIEQCLFGLHLLSDLPIGLVESEKTACIMSGKLPDFTWMATGGKSNLSKVEVLKGKRVVAFPDTDAFDDWKERLSPYGFKISDALQRHVSESGYDLADFVQPAKAHLETLWDGRQIEINSHGYPSDWQ